MRKRTILTYKQTRSNQIVAVGLYLEAGKLRFPLSQRQLNDIIDFSRDGIEVEGDTITSLCEVDTFVGAKDGGGLDFVVASRDEETGIRTV